MTPSSKAKGSAGEHDGGAPPAVYVQVPPGILFAMFALAMGMAFAAGWLAGRPPREEDPRVTTSPASAAPPPALPRPAASSPNSVTRSPASSAPTEGHFELRDPLAGNLEFTPLMVTPAPESIEELGWTSRERVWHLRGMVRDQAEQFFRACGLSDAARDELWKSAKTEPGRTDAFTFAPPDTLVRDLARESRVKLYVRLAEEDDNLDQVNAYHAVASDLDAWLAPAELPPDTLRLVKSLCYKYQQYWLFADLPLVLPELNEPERRRLLETLSTHRSWLVRLRIDSNTDVDKLARYYGRGGRADTLLPYLKALKRVPGGTWISLRALLPPFVQTHLNLFPKPSEDPVARARDCHWTALNFFSDQPDDRFAADHNLVLPEIHKNYHRVNTDFRLGDVVLFLAREKGAESARYFHSAVYIAPGIYFAKNGRRPTSPWMFMRVEDAIAWYPRTQEVLLLTYRRNDLSD